MRYFILCLCMATTLVLGAQQASAIKATPSSAEQKLKNGNYEEALEDYLELLAEEPDNLLYHYNAAVCYLNTNGGKPKAVAHLELVTNKDKDYPNAQYLLGRAYHYANRFDEAIRVLSEFKQSGKGTAYNMADAELEIQYCINAKELVKYPVNASFENLGGNINSEYNDYFPFVTTDEAFVVYNTRRPGKNARRLDNGNYLTAIYVSTVEEGKYTKAKNIGAPVSKGNTGVEVIGMNDKGDILLLYVPDGKGKGDIYISTRDAKGNYTKPKVLDKTINAGDEIAASISSDGNTIFFASDRKGGLGGIDIYQSQRLPDGRWSEPKNLGPEINTSSNEDFPNISPDGKTLYYSSKGKTSMGGYDIFKATYNDDRMAFTNPQNLGFPINTTDDDFNFRVSGNGKYGYIASVRPGGLGDFDIYRLNFNEVESENTVISGNILADGNIKYSEVLITVNDKASKRLVGNYVPNHSTGHYIMILLPGKYTLRVKAPGYKTIEKEIEVYDKVSYQSEISMDLPLSK